MSSSLANENPLDRMCRQAGVERNEMLAASRQEFQEISRHILKYNITQHAAAFTAWNAAWNDRVVVLSDGDSSEEKSTAAERVPTRANEDKPSDEEDAGNDADSVNHRNAQEYQATPRKRQAIASATSRLKKQATVTPQMSQPPTSSATSPIGNDMTEMQVESTEVDEDTWVSTIEEANKIYRMREFNKRSKDPKQDKFGRRPSIYDLEHGVVMTGIPPPAMNEILPLTTNVSSEVVVQAFDSATSDRRQWNMDRSFCAMQPGDLVCLMIPNKPFQHEICIGVITTNEMKIQKVQELAADIGLETTYGIDYLALRQVKWLRQARVRDLPGQETSKKGSNHVPWLCESSPLYFLNVTKKGAKEHLASDSFLACSSVFELCA